MSNTMANPILNLDLRHIFELSLIQTGNFAAYPGVEAVDVDIMVFPEFEEQRDADDLSEPACATFTVMLAGRGLRGFSKGEIPWGLVNDKDEIVETGLTDVRGLFTVTVPEGMYRVKYVMHKTKSDRLTRKIRSSLGLEESVVKPDRGDRTRATTPQYRILATNSELFERGATSDEGEVASGGGEMKRLDNELEIVLPDHELPFGLVRIWAIHSADSNSIGSVVIPMIAFKGGRRGRIDVDRLIGHAAPDVFEFDAEPVVNDPEVLANIDFNHVQKLLDLEAVRADSDLYARIETLVTLLKGM